MKTAVPSLKARRCPSGGRTLEVRLARLTKRFDRLYNRSYARLVRRQACDQTMLTRSREWVTRLTTNKSVLQRIVVLLRQVKAGKTVVFLSRPELRRLYMLIGRKEWGWPSKRK